MVQVVKVLTQTHLHPPPPTMAQVLLEMERNRKQTALILERIAKNTAPGYHQHQGNNGNGNGNQVRISLNNFLAVWPPA